MSHVNKAWSRIAGSTAEGSNIENSTAARPNVAGTANDSATKGDASTATSIGAPPRTRRLGRLMGAAAGAGMLAAACIIVGAGWTPGDYSPQPRAPISHAGSVRGLTVLVSFTPEPGSTNDEITNDHAKKLYRMLNEKGYRDNGNAGSLRDYYLDMSGGRFDLQNDVVRVTLNHPRSYYDENKEDSYDAVGISSIEEVRIDGPATRLLNDVLCQLVQCGGQAPRFDEVTATNVTSGRTNDFDFGALSTTPVSFWPDHFIRSLSHDSRLIQPDLRRSIDIPKLAGIRHLGILYAGATKQGPAKGLWPRTVPAVGTFLPNGNRSIRFGRFYIAGTIPPSGDPIANTTPLPAFIALPAHESGHAMFGLPDLYDPGLDFPLHSSAPRPHTNGVGLHDIMGDPESQTQPSAIGAPLRDRLGWSDVIDISDAAEGTLVTLKANSGQTARYCRPNSTARECFYIEARSMSAPRGPSLMPARAPDEGLAIWHAEDGQNILDSSVNNNAQGTAALHHEVALLEADGRNELQNSGPYNGAGDYFKAGSAERFDATTSPSSNWWDGSASGLSIRRVSAPGASMTFEIGRRPMSQVYVETDANVQVNAGDRYLRVGQKRRVTFSGRAGFRYDVSIRGNSSLDPKGLTGVQEIEITGSQADNHIKVVSYPAEASAPTRSDLRNVRFLSTEGVEIVSFADSGRTRTAGSPSISPAPGRMSFLPGRLDNSSEPDLSFRTQAGQPSIKLVAKARPGYVLKHVKTFAPGQDVSGAEGIAHEYAGQLAVDLSAPQASYTGNFLVSAYAEPIPGYLCRQGFTSDWSASQVYTNVGDLVRYGDYIYASLVPHNVLWGNVNPDYTISATPSLNPENTPDHWARVASCKAYVEDCSAVPEFKLNTTAPTLPQGSKVRLNGVVYEALTTNPATTPGVNVSESEWVAATTYSQVDRSFPIYDNRPFFYPRRGDWKLIGNCSNPELWKRAAIVPSAGVATITAVGVSSIQRHPSEPLYVTNVNGAWSFNFTLEPGFALRDVYIDGKPLGLLPSARSATVPFSTSQPKPSYIEIKTQCSNSLCQSTITPSVSCTIGTPNVWSNGFQFNVTVTNTSGAALTNWNVALPFAWTPTLWNSANMKFKIEGSVATFSNGEAWNGKLAPNQTYTFSVSGPRSSTWVTPTCVGL